MKGRLAMTAVGLFLLACPPCAQAQQPVRKPSPALIKYGKWLTLAASLGMNYFAAKAHARADDAFAVIEDACGVDRHNCDTFPNGTYVDPLIEAKYQESVRYDRRARNLLIGGQTALLATAAAFIWELTRPKNLPGNIPFEPRVSQRAGQTYLGFRVDF